MSDELRDSVKKIGSRELNVRKPATEYVIAAGNKAVAALLENLTSGDGYLREITVAVLWEIEREEGINHPAIVQALDGLIRSENNALNQQDAVGLLTDIYWRNKDDDVVSTLINLLKSDDEFVREFAADALGEIRAKRAVLPLMDVLKDSDWYVSRIAMQALGWIGDASAVNALIGCLDDLRADLQHRTNASVAADILLEFGTPEALSAVKEWQNRQF